MCPSLVQRYFRRLSADEDPERLLQAENQWSEPWGAADHGPCEKCRGEGNVLYRCLSCLEGSADPGCPACAGRVEFHDVCPSCDGSGTVARTRRPGLSVFPTIEGLYRYLAEQDGELPDYVAELEGELSGDRDLDADAGALLVRPTKVVAVHPFDHARVRARRART
jgi:hypothetical protein